MALASQPYVNHLDNRTLSIMERSEVTLKQPYLNRPFLDSWTEKIATSKEHPSSRWNPMYAALAGRGKGKTRFFVELEKALNQRSEQDVLAVAITFSGNWAAVKVVDDKDDEVSMAVEVVLRMLTMAYSIPDFDRFRADLTQALRRWQSHQDDPYIGTEALLKECVTFLVEDRRRSRPCTRFVLLVDEPEKLIAKGIDANAFYSLRNALLNDEMPGFRVNLAMAVLTKAPTGASQDSGRLIPCMPLPLELKVQEAYAQWLPAHLPQLSPGSIVADSTERRLNQLLTLTAQSPRATQTLAEVLGDEFPADQPLSFTKEVTARVLKAFSARLETVLSEAGKGATVVLKGERLAYDLLWRKPFKWTDDTYRAMVDGYVVNAPENPFYDWAVLSALSLCRLKTYPVPEMSLLTPAGEATSNIVFDPATYHEPHTLGRPLAMMANTFLTCKALSAERVDHGEYSLFELLGCDGGSPRISKFRSTVLKLNRCPRPLEDLYHPTPLPCSRDAVNDHVAALRQCQLERRDVLVVTGHDREAWDGLWVLRQTDGKPFVLAVAYKFRELVRDADAASDDGDTRQAEHFRDTIVAACREAFPGTAGHDDGSAAAAIAAGDFAFVYIDTAPSDEAKGDVSRVFDDHDRYVRLTGAAALEIFPDAGRQVLDIVRLSPTAP